MSEATYTAWDDNSYPWPPPDGWYQAGDGKWWPEGYGPQAGAEGTGQVEESGSATETTAVATTAASDGPTSASSSTVGASAAGYSSAAAAEGSSVRTSSSEIFERMQREAAEGGGRPWASSEAVTEAPSLTGDSAGSVLGAASGAVSETASETVSDGMSETMSDSMSETASSAGFGTATDNVASTMSENAEGFIERRSSGLVAGAGAAAAAVGASAFTSSGDTEGAAAESVAPDVQVQDVEAQDVASAEHSAGFNGEYTASDSAAGFADADYSAPDAVAASDVATPDYSAPEYTTPEYSAPDYTAPEYSTPGTGSDAVGVVDHAASGYVDDGHAAAPTTGPVGDVDQPIPGQQLPSNYDDGFSSSYTQGSYTEPGYEVDQGSGLADPSPLDAGVSPVDVDAGQPVADAVPGDAPWDDPAVDTAVNPVVQADGPHDVAANVPGALREGHIGSPDAAHDPFAPAQPSGPAFDDGRFASYDNRGQMDRQQSPGPLLAPPVRDEPKRRRGRGLLMSLVVLAALALAGLAGYFFYQQQQGDDGGAEVAASDTGDAAAGSLTNPHDSSRAVQIEYTAEDVAQVWTIQATSSAQTDLGSSTEIQADLTLANGNTDGQAALADLIVSVVDANGEVLASGANDCTNTQAMSWGQSVAGGASVSGPVCWVVPTESVDGALLGIESTKAQGRIHIRLP